jgi:GNAT superfamily N-acetyltransferase
MSDKFGFVIRDGMESDIPGCLALETAYTTDYVWQMTVDPESSQRSISFKTDHLPRSMDVDYPISEHRLRTSQCFLVAVGRDDPAILGLLTMSPIPARRTALIHDIVVSQPFRRHRIGTRLLNVARRWAEEHQLISLIAETQTKNYPGILFCQKASMSFCGYNDHYFDNQDIAVFFGQTLNRGRFPDVP